MSATANATKCYKLTTQEQMTGGLKWQIGEWHSVSGVGNLCSPNFLHAYRSPLCAIFMNPLHAKIVWPRLWIAEALGAEKQDAGLKVGYAQLRLVEEILPPVISQEQRIRLALMASLAVCENPVWRGYAHNYLEGTLLRLYGVSNSVEPQQEQLCRMYAYKAASYDMVEHNSAMAMQIAAQYKYIDTEEIFRRAYGEQYIEVKANGRTREMNAMGS